MNGAALPALHAALAGVVLATALGSQRTPLLGAGGVAALAVALAVVWAAAPMRGPLSPWRASAIAALLGALLGGVSVVAWAHRPDPWTPRVGESVTVEGQVDARRLRIPGREDLLLKGRAPSAGWVRLRGVLEPLAEPRNPGGFDEAGFWWRRGVRVALRVEAVEAQRPPRALAAVRARLQAGVRAGLGAQAAALQQALTLGVRDDLGGLRDRFAAAGMAHLLALSGVHVGVLAAAVALLARPLGRRWSGVPVVAVVVAYVAVVGPTPSVVRAAAMVTAVVVTRALGVVTAPLEATLASAALLLLLAQPAWVGDIGFVLSFVSVAGIAVLAGPLLARSGAAPRGADEASTSAALRRAGRWALLAAATSASAQAATLSLVAGSFGAVPVAAPLVNLLAVPLASALVPLGALAAVAGVVHEGLAALVNLVTEPLAIALIRLADAAARLPALAWGEVGPEGHALLACALIACAAASRGRVRWSRALLIVACASGVALALPERHPRPELIVLDVGQGDAVVLRLGGGRAVLVDAGGVSLGGFDAGERIVVPALRALGIWHLPLMVVTHADLDHVGGAPAVLAAMPVAEVWYGHAEPERPAWQALERAATDRGVALRPVRRGQAARFGDVTIEVLHPTHEPLGGGNADSVALLLRYRGAAWALLLGDVPAAVEADLAVPRAPVLLAPHHGSATSTGDALLRAARPRVVLVSVGANRYGHPAQTVLDRLAGAGVPVLSTREHGALRSHPWRACVHVEMSRPGGRPVAAC